MESATPNAIIVVVKVDVALPLLRACRECHVPRIHSPLLQDIASAGRYAADVNKTNRVIMPALSNAKHRLLPTCDRLSCQCTRSAAASRLRWPHGGTHGVGRSVGLSVGRPIGWLVVAMG